MRIVDLLSLTTVLPVLVAACAAGAAEPQVIVATMQTIDGFDLKNEAWTAYCASAGVTCPVPAAQ